MVHIIIHNVGNNGDIQNTFPIKLYQPEEDPTVGQIFLCLVVSTLNSKKRNKLILHLLSRPEVF